MLRDLPLILGIRSIVIVVLIDNDDTLRIPFRISEDIEKDRDMLLRGISKGVVRLTIEAGDDKSLILGWESTLHTIGKIYERKSSLPLIRRHISLITYYLCKCSTLSSILSSHGDLRKLRIYTITSI